MGYVIVTSAYTLGCFGFANLHESFAYIWCLFTFSSFLEHL